MAAEVYRALHRGEKLELKHARDALQRGLHAFAQHNASQARASLTAAEQMLEHLGMDEHRTAR